MDTEKLAILQQSIEYRNKEILEYQVNIDNFTRALTKIELEYSSNTDMQEFKNVIIKNLNDTIREQTKCKILRDVMQDQINEATN